MRAAIVECDMTTAYGRGLSATWDGLVSGRTAFSSISHFDCGQLGCRIAAVAKDGGSGPGRVFRLVEPLLADIAPAVPAGAFVYLATTTGEIDRLERHREHGEGSPDDSRPERLLERIRARLVEPGPGRVVSAACASSTVALAMAADDVTRGRCEAALVVACDAVTEFVFSGFASLHALDPAGARPFDRNRHGLTLGEAAAVALVMSEERARQERRDVRGTILGWGLSCDANHMTGPARDGNGLARAVAAALARSGSRLEAIGSICAHGTGTSFNDAMELRAFGSVFGDQVPPVYSIKGGLGHTLGAAGLVEALVAIESLRRGLVPASPNLAEPDDDARGIVTTETRSQPKEVALSTNSGFGGINAAIAVHAEGERLH